MAKINEELLEKMKCSACSTFMCGPIYECPSGDRTCGKCWEKYCPVCQRKLTRSPTLESIGKLVEIPCFNAKLGCNFNCTMADMKNHLQICDWRDYKCKLDKDCDWIGQRDEIKNHAVTEHPAKVLLTTANAPQNTNVCFWKATNKPDHEVFLLSSFGALFYLHRRLKDNTMYWALQLIGKPDDTNLYGFKLQLLTDQFENRKLQFTEICHDDVVDIEEITEAGYCIAVPLSILKTYADCNYTVYYEISVEKL